MRKAYLIFPLLLGCLLCPREWSTAPAQSTQENDQKEKPFTLEVDVDLVNVSVGVMDSFGKYLLNLKKDDFKVFEDKVEQKITNFSPVDAPFCIGLILDTSYSTVNKLGKIQDEAILFTQQIHPDDEVMVVSFDDTVHLETDFTQNRHAVERAIKMTRTGQSTQLYEAVYLALHDKLRKKRERKAMVLFTDGVDTSSPTSSAHETIEEAKEADTIIFPIFFDTRRDVLQSSRTTSPIPRTGGGPSLPLPSPFPRIDPQSPTQRQGDDERINMEYLQGRHYLQDLANATGGTLYVAEGVDSLGDVFAQIAAELRSLYALGYVSSNQKKDGKFRKISVTVNLPNATVKAKKGYLAKKG
ncbi:MAG: VWA domain-containing protein [Terriglobia bacterium]